MAPPTVVENLNRLMYGSDMIAKIPAEVREKSDAGMLEQQLHDYLSGGKGREKDNTAIQLKRQLLEKYYQLPKYLPAGIGTYATVSRRSGHRLAGVNRFSGEILWQVPVFPATPHACRRQCLSVGRV